MRERELKQSVNIDKKWRKLSLPMRERELKHPNARRSL